MRRNRAPPELLLLVPLPTAQVLRVISTGSSRKFPHLVPSRFLPRGRNKVRGVGGQAGPVEPVQPPPSLLLWCRSIPWAQRVTIGRVGPMSRLLPDWVRERAGRSEGSAPSRHTDIPLPLRHKPVPAQPASAGNEDRCGWLLSRGPHASPWSPRAASESPSHRPEPH